jgi:hypothetical protein
MEENNKKQTINILINLGFLLAIIFVCVVLTTTIVMFYKNMEIIRNDPITYVMKQMNFTQCNCKLGSQEAAVCYCIDTDNKEWSSFGKMFKHTESYEERFSDIVNDINLNLDNQ